MIARKLACIIGWPVAESLSPAIHNAAFEALGLDWTYVPLAVRPGAIDEGMTLLRELDVQGANVTMPHKQSIVPYLQRLEGDAKTLRAVNTIVRDGKALVGENTDGPGFLAAIAEEAGFVPRSKRALVLGAGGAARAVAVALARAGAAVVVSARRAEQAAEVPLLSPGIETFPWGAPTKADLVVNATPSRDGLPLDSVGFAPGVLAVDLIYLPPSTGFVLSARAAGATALDGLGMLVHQAALSFRLWTGRDAPLQVMQEAARAAVEGSDLG
ncbi:MAG TPA: shikimate dehydrogenase [Actinomycetota bacterium]|nr:shikimate dehydrogenase [Actinomycetota bacterium]